MPSEFQAANPGSPAPRVAGTMRGKVYVGYQGWFNAPGDGMGLGYRHYMAKAGFEPGACSIDVWPDLSEFDQDHTYPTPFKHADGSVARVFSSCDFKTVDTHVRWMAEYGINGAFLQRFGTDIMLPTHRVACDRVLDNIRVASAKHGTEYALMYDLSGLRGGEIDGLICEDFKSKLKAGIFKDHAYIRHEGRPVIAVWGIGFNDRRLYSLNECADFIRYIKSGRHAHEFAVLLGVPYHWRTMGDDTVNDPMLHQIIREADIVLPWSVGRYRTPEQVSALQPVIQAPDIQWTKSHGLEYMPVIFPGFSWRNLRAGLGVETRFDEIPRLGGRFFWAQAQAAAASGARMVYVAMFDELDESTAIMKLCPDPPVGESRFLACNDTPPDHYLRLAGRVRGLLAGQRVPAPRQTVT